MIKIFSYLFRNGPAGKGSVFHWRFAGGVICAALLAVSVGAFAQTTTHSYALVTNYNPDANIAYLKRYDISDLTAAPAVWSFPNEALGAPEFSSDGSKIYVPGMFEDKIYVINTTAAGGTIAATLDNPDTVDHSPISLAVSDDYLYVLNHESNTVRRIILATNATDSSWAATLPAVSGDEFPYVMTISGDGSKLYVSNHFSHVFVINTANPVLPLTMNIQTLSASLAPATVFDIQWANTSGGKKLYVTDASSVNATGSVNGKIHVFWEDGTYKSSIDLPCMPMSLTSSPSRNNRVYVGLICESGENNIAVIDASTDTLMPATLLLAHDKDAMYYNLSLTAAGDKLLAIAPTINGGKMVAYSINSSDQLSVAGSVEGDQYGTIMPNAISFSNFASPAPKALSDPRTASVRVTLKGETSLYTADYPNFNFSLSCTGSVSTSATGAFAVPVADGYAEQSFTTDVLEGSECTITDNSAFAITGTTIAATFANGTTRAIYDPTGNAGINTFEVEYHIRSGVHQTAQLTVKKEITGTLAGHDPALDFAIDVVCTDASSAASVNTTVSLYGGASTTVTAFTGDQCAISEPSPPTPNAGYEYVASVVPSRIDEITFDRTVTVTNQVVADTVDATTVTVTIAPTTGETTASGYIPGRNLFPNITLTCSDGGTTVTEIFTMAEREQATLSFAGLSVGYQCTLTGATTTTPSLNSGYGVRGATVTGGGASFDAGHEIYRHQQPVAAPIPTLDTRALFLLIGLMFGAMLWQLRRRRG